MRVDLYPRPSLVPWHTSYLTVAALNIGLLIGLYHAFPHLYSSSGLVPAGLVIGMFTLTSLLHWYDVTADRVPERRR